MQNSHINRYEYPGSRCCRFCKRFVFKENLQEHIRQKHKRNQCEVCEKVYFNLMSFRSHKKTHEALQYSCDHCNYKTVTKQSLKCHIVVLHLHNNETPRSECELCGKMIISCKLKKHTRDVHKNRQEFHCDVCNKEFSGVTKLRDHLALAHLEEQNYVCTICNRNYSSKATLSRHTDSVHEAKPKLECGKCKRTFNLPCNYRRHLKAHEKRPFSCTHLPCHSMFKTEEARKKHISFIHINPKGYRLVKHRCDKCNKTYTTRNNLELHEMTHLGLKFQCEYCGKEYGQKGRIREHLFKQHVNKH